MPSGIFVKGDAKVGGKLRVLESIEVAGDISVEGTIVGYNQTGHKHGVADLIDVYSKTEVDSKIAPGWDSKESIVTVGVTTQAMRIILSIDNVWIKRWEFYTDINGLLYLDLDKESVMTLSSSGTLTVRDRSIEVEDGSLLWRIKDSILMTLSPSGTLSIGGWTTSVENNGTLVWRAKGFIVMTLSTSGTLKINGTLSQNSNLSLRPSPIIRSPRAIWPNTGSGPLYSSPAMYINWNRSMDKMGTGPKSQPKGLRQIAFVGS